MKIQGSRLAALSALVFGLGIGTNAHAVWTFANTNVTSSTVFTDTVDSSLTVKLSAVYANNTTFAGNGTWSAATLTNQGNSGQGVCSTGDSSGTPCDSPDHAVDNNVNTEGVLLNFSRSISISSIGMGWVNSSNTDISLFRWTGSGNPTGSPTALIGQDANSMTGWELVGNYGDINADTQAPYSLVNSSGKGSSWWLVSAYNSGYVQSTGTENRGTVNNGGDYFKLFAVAGSKCTSTVNGQCGPTNKTPEPGSLALAGLALFGVFYSRRRNKSLS